MSIRISVTIGGLLGITLLLGVGGAAASNGPGTRTHPIPLHQSAPIGEHWTMKLLSVTPHAEQALGTGETCGNPTPTSCTTIHPKPPPGAQGYMVGVSLRYIGGGSSSTQTVLIFAIGSHDAAYGGHGCDRSELVDGTQVFSEQSVTGKVCFMIANNDAATLRLFVRTISNFQEQNAGLANPASTKAVWFALR